MSKNTRTRILLTAVAALLLVGMAVGGTLAWLQDTTEEVVNKFTPSDVDINLTETTGETYKMVPSVDISKNPKVTVEIGSEACYVYVVIEEVGMVTVGTETKTFDDYLSYAIDSGWDVVSGSKTDNLNDVYVIGKAVASTVDATSATEIAILSGNKVTTKSDVTKAMMDALTDANYPQLSFQAYAIQQANGASTFTLQTAWTQLGVTLPTATNP